MVPLFRWPGGKRWLAPRLREVVAHVEFGRYIEPFFGGGALFLATQPKSAILADNNVELITTYEAIRDSPGAVHAALHEFSPGREAYYAARATKPIDAVPVAARFLYLRANAFGGLYRVNAAGRFNVPYGGQRRKSLPSVDDLVAVGSALRGRTLLTADYRDVVFGLAVGDLLYLDPPYVSSDSSREMFNRYLNSVFTLADQEALAKSLIALAGDGVFIIASNSADTKIRDLYPRDIFHQLLLQRASSFATDPSFRRPVVECVFVSRNLPISRELLSRYLACDA